MSSRNINSVGTENPVLGHLFACNNCKTVANNACRTLRSASRGAKALSSP